jgi:hypothetical protein
MTNAHAVIVGGKIIRRENGADGRVDGGAAHPT